MSYKLGLILSFPFLIQIMLFCGDLSIVESIHTQLDSIAQTISIKISQQGCISTEVKEYVWEQCEATVSCLSGCSGFVGDIITYSVYKKYKPIIISSDEMFISVTRSTVVGYYS